MEDMGSYFRKWREWRNIDLGSKSSTSIEGVGKDEAKHNQSINQQINRLNVNQQTLAFNNFNKLSISFQLLAFKFLVVAKFLANLQHCYFIHLQ